EGLYQRTVIPSGLCVDIEVLQKDDTVAEHVEEPAADTAPFFASGPVPTLGEVQSCRVGARRDGNGIRKVAIALRLIDARVSGAPPSLLPKSPAAAVPVRLGRPNAALAIGISTGARQESNRAQTGSVAGGDFDGVHECKALLRPEVQM